ncbi:hypothetical protein ACFRAO_31305 [Streptomyces sp. NPDC056656]|uniref:hypothetical protein n=1 Tax=Streptomyces sp. NPDC056656 TaxID=3345895 RepID=UPI003685F850
MTPRLRTTGRPLLLPPSPLWRLLFLALLLGPATSGTYAYAAEPAPTRAPTSAPAPAPASADETQAGSHPGKGRTPPGRAESKPPAHDRPEQKPPRGRPSGEHSAAEPSAAKSSAPDTEKPSASASPRRPSASHANPKTSPAKASPADPSRKGHSRKGHSAGKSHSASASAAVTPKRSRPPSADPPRSRPAHASILVPPEEPQDREDGSDEQQVQPSARPTDVPVDTAGRTPRPTVAEPVIPGVGVLPLGSGLVLVGLGVGFLALRLRRT